MPSRHRQQKAKTMSQKKSLSFSLLSLLLLPAIVTCEKRRPSSMLAFCQTSSLASLRTATTTFAATSVVGQLNSTKEEEKDSMEDEGVFKQLNIAFVTGNEMKKKEMQMILTSHGATRGPDENTSLVKLRSVNVDLPEIQEVSTEAIAKNKAIQGAQLANGPCVVEDTSLQFSALGGMPGPYIKWFQQKLGSDGLYKILYAYEDKSATAVCTLAFCPYPHADPVLFTGRTEGTIVEPVLGRGFGWDSIFVPNGEDEPFSCMSTEKKNSLSHRGKAVRQWADWLGKNQDELWERQGGRAAIGHKGLDFKSSFAEE
uniref:XTP/dITP diphosphatase n=1 Tax=Ditylum brightwellii TaxID=49249 RepID=A0A6V2NI74_9STRA|mmetsp:Transcript_130/g.210  ORF Transcript_130/g.210 Transcript_130/m.210 type:complete len:314 (+) Transcript_130:101-1042(+)